MSGILNRVCILVLAFVVAGCDGKEDPPPPSATDAPVIFSSATELSVMEGDIVPVDIRISAYPPSTVTLYKGEDVVFQYDLDYVADRVRWGSRITNSAVMSDAGEYHFVIENMNGSVSSDPIQLIVVERTEPAGAVLATTEQVAWVSGLYNASRDVSGIIDEAYYYIDSQGVFHTYDYRGDALNAEANCYRAQVAGEINSGLEGKRLYWREGSGELVVRVSNASKPGSFDLRYRMTEEGDVSDICIGNTCGSAGVNVGLPVGIVVKTATVELPEITDIQSAICAE